MKPRHRLVPVFLWILYRHRFILRKNSQYVVSFMEIYSLQYIFKFTINEYFSSSRMCLTTTTKTIKLDSGQKS